VGGRESGEGVSKKGEAEMLDPQLVVGIEDEI
jgi:hypothetical protein